MRTLIDFGRQYLMLLTLFLERSVLRAVAEGAAYAKQGKPPKPTGHASPPPLRET